MNIAWAARQEVDSEPIELGSNAVLFEPNRSQAIGLVFGGLWAGPMSVLELHIVDKLVQQSAPVLDALGNPWTNKEDRPVRQAVGTPEVFADENVLVLVGNRVSSDTGENCGWRCLRPVTL
jgi:hypothetical protein